MKPALLLLLFIAIVAPTSTVAAEPVKVFVFTNEVPSGAVDEQLKARRESVQDLVKAFSDAKFRSQLALVKNRDLADVVVELVSRGETTTSSSNSSTRASNGASTSAARSSSVTKQFMKFRISAGQRTEDLTVEDQLSWPKMAARAADEIVKWISVYANAARRP